MKVITFLTNLGESNYETGILKGSILAKVPEVKIADLTHGLEYDDVIDAAVILKRHSPYFPDGSVHLYINLSDFDLPARPIAAKIGRQYYVGPDNGFLTLLINEVEINGNSKKIILLDHEKSTWENPNPLYYYSDYFVSIASKLVSGISLEMLGKEIDDPALLNIAPPERMENGWKGQILRADHFGNLESNIHTRLLKGLKISKIRCCGVEIDGLVDTFGNSATGELVAMIDSSGVVSISQVNGSATKTLNCETGAVIEVIFEK